MSGNGSLSSAILSRGSSLTQPTTIGVAGTGAVAGAAATAGTAIGRIAVRN